MKILLLEIESHYPHISELKADLARIFGMEISTHKKLLYLDQASFSTRKKKWNAEKMLGEIESEVAGTPDSEFFVLGLFPHDIYANSLNFVYGLSEHGGHFSAISYFRLDPKFYNKGIDEKLLKERVLKESVHEIGHLQNLDHCKNKSCVMSFSPNILFVDKKSAKFCERCEFLR